MLLALWAGYFQQVIYQKVLFHGFPFKQTKYSPVKDEPLAGTAAADGDIQDK